MTRPAALVCAACVVAVAVGPAGAQAAPRAAGPGPGPGVIPVPALELRAPMLAYRTYVRGLLAVVESRLSALPARLQSGDVAGAESAWLAAHLAWLQIGQDDGAYGAFGAIGRHIDGTAAGLVKGHRDPASRDFTRWSSTCGPVTISSRPPPTPRTPGALGEPGWPRGRWPAAAADPDRASPLDPARQRDPRGRPARLPRRRGRVRQRDRAGLAHRRRAATGEMLTLWRPALDPAPRGSSAGRAASWWRWSARRRPAGGRPLGGGRRAAARRRASASMPPSARRWRRSPRSPTSFRWWAAS